MEAEKFDIEKLFNKIRQLEIHTPQGVSGMLTKESQFVFNYNRGQDDMAVSLTMPLREKSYSSGDLMGVFAMNRPEGYLRHVIEDRLLRMGAPNDMLLLFLAGSNQIGRLTYHIPGMDIPQHNYEILDDLLKSPSGATFKRLIDQYALSSGISGMQPKALVPVLDQAVSHSLPLDHTTLPIKTLIVKTEGWNYPGIARNEFFCMSVAEKAGFDVPKFWLSDDGKMFVMSRFDRKEDGTALGFEDMAVLTGRTNQEKYEGSYEMVADAVHRYSGIDSARQLQRLFERVALSCFLRDGDAHLKNFGMLYDHPGLARKLSPIYDVVCTDIYPDLVQKLALKLNDSKTYPTDKDIAQYGKRLGLNTATINDTLERIESAYQAVMTDLKQDTRYKDGMLLTEMNNVIKRTELQRVKMPANKSLSNTLTPLNQLAIVTTGHYIGTILSINDNIVMQKTNANGTIVRHEAGNLTGTYKQNDVVEIKYSKGKASVIVQKSNEIDRG